MNIRNISSRAITLTDTPGNVYTVPAYNQLTLGDALWTDNVFRSSLRYRIRDIVVESLIGGGGANAPIDATYVTTASNASLTNEVVLGNTVIAKGVVANRPAASTPGLLYYSTDSNLEHLSRDNGSSWDDLFYSWSYITNATTINSNARLAVAKAGVTTGTRRTLNLIEGNGITITETDDSPGEKVDVTVATTSPRTLVKVNASVVISASNTLTALVSTSIPGNTLGTNKKLRCVFWGDLLYNSGAPTARFVIAYGGTTIYDSPATAIAVSANRRTWRIDFELAALGLTNSQVGNGTIGISNATLGTVGLGSALVAPFVHGNFGGSIAVDSTVSQTLGLSWIHSVNNPAVDIRMHHATIEVVS